jgi:transcriptional regulator with XRE-family HTH domain
MPVTRELDPGASPLAFFGAELRRARTAAGLSQEQLGQRIGYSAALVGKAETGERAPSRDFAKGCDQALPGADGLFARLHVLIQRWGDIYPSWFGDWIEAERRAESVCCWEPLLVPGLVQTADYARALFEAWRQPEDEIDQLVSIRMDRQSIFDRPDPPLLWVIVDEAVLYRRIDSAKIMYDQLAYLADVANRPNVTVQVVPAEVGAHVGLQGAFAIVSADGASTLYLEGPNQGQITETPSVVATVSATFDTLRAEALPRVTSRDLIRRVAEEQWTS